MRRARGRNVGVCVLIVVAAAAQSAAAAERPAKPRKPLPPGVHDWRGFYAGFNAGAVRGTVNATTTTSPGTYLTDPADIAAVDAAGMQTIKPLGFTGGAEAGFNWQWSSSRGGSWVAGIEADYQFLHLSGSANSGAVKYPKGPPFEFVLGAAALPINQFVVTSYANADWLATVRPRLGYAVNNWMFYATGGLALTALKDDFVFTDGVAAIGTLTNESARIDDVLKLGTVVGGGVEAALTDRLSLKAEYLHVNFGATAATLTANNLPAVLASFPASNSQSFSQSGNLRADIVRMGLNYRFSGDDAADESGAPRMAVKAPPRPASAVFSPTDWEFEMGARSGFSGGSLGVPQPLYNTPQILTSRLGYSDLNALSGESYARLDHTSGWFVKGFLGAGGITGGTLIDEDFPASNAYSRTQSAATGSLGYAAVDLGYALWQAPGAKVGPFVGYNYFTQHLNAYGCTQLAGSAACQPSGSFSPGFLSVSEDDHFNALRLGVSAEFMLADDLKLTGDAAYLPSTTFSGVDNHTARELLLPSQSPNGDGVMLEAVLSYDVTDQWNVGIGGRYWAYNARLGTTTFDFLGASGTQPVEPASMNAERYGVFLQTGYHWGDTTPVRGGSDLVAKAPSIVAPMDWTGLYVGGRLGGGFSNARWSDPFGSAASGLGGTNVAGFGDTSHATGPFAGGQIGANWQVGALVLGLEADGGRADLRGDATCFTGLGGIDCGHVVKALATATGRVGFAFDRSLLYAKAGGAWAETAYSLNGNTFNVALGTGSTSLDRSGWVAGIGVEYALSNHWTTRVEYDHVGLGTVTVPFPSVATINARSIDISQSIDLMTLGVNYKFDWPMVAKN